jgi:hypothetical protein
MAYGHQLNHVPRMASRSYGRYIRLARNAMATVAAVMVLHNASIADAQWLKYPTPGIARTADGKADLKAPAPRTADGKPDLTGVWQMRLHIAYVANLVADLNPVEIMPWADKVSRQRISDFGKDDPWNVGCLPSGPRAIVGGRPGALLVKITQTPHVITMLFEDLTYRQIFLDGRELPREPTPSFMGYSVGHWEGDTLVVESIGFNDRTWLDSSGHPHTEALRTAERFQRRNVGTIDLRVTLEDEAAYTRPWTVPVNLTLAPDTDLLEYVCNENETRRLALSGRTEEQKRMVVPVETLSKYVGSYAFDRPVPGAPFETLDVRLVNGELVLDVDGKGSVPLMPISTTRFSGVLFFELEFRLNQRGAMEAEIAQAGVRLVRK